MNGALAWLQLGDNVLVDVAVLFERKYCRILVL
jgi:hypothetical protein